jgi:phosphoribosylaminoimidazolecarboxamide formyltransferase/IMP cyclohydrolase
MRAILSVYDKTGLVDFARGLADLGAEIYSTGGTHKALDAAGVPARSVSELTGFPEILDGRVKTLHPAVHGALLARRDDPEHMRELERQGIGPIDLVAVNLYPFVETVRRLGGAMPSASAGGEGTTASEQEALENIDIGGPTMLRAAAKNYPHVLVVVDPADYEPLLALLRSGQVPQEERRRLAAKAFQHVASYDTAISQYLRQEKFPQGLTISLEKRFDLRYGENPHQKAALYQEPSLCCTSPPGIVSATQLHGIDLSYVNVMDADAAWNAACDFEGPAVAIVKHTNPCGLATDEDVVEAYRRALAGDPISAFGGIVAVNRPVDGALAQEIRESRHPTSGQRLFLEIVIAPEFTEEALELLRKSRNLRILQASPVSPKADDLESRQISGGLLIQTPDLYPDNELDLRVVTKRAPTEEEMADLRFAWKAVKHVKSNSIVLCKDSALVGMGAGQPNRVTSVHLALRTAGERSQGSVMASDAFFPFPDGVELAADGGVTAVIEPGGSIRDEEVIAAADVRGMAMVFTGRRHFRH